MRKIILAITISLIACGSVKASQHAQGTSFIAYPMDAQHNQHSNQAPSRPPTFTVTLHPHATQLKDDPSTNLAYPQMDHPKIDRVPIGSLKPN